MATKLVHQSSGWAAGAIAAAVATTTLPHDPFHVWAALTFMLGFSGGTAPDWLEIAWWRFGRGRHLWVQHRTWTHWGVAWLALLACSYVGMQHYAWFAMLFGFAAGGVMHLLADWPNPMGVPWLLVSRRHSLKLWKSGNCNALVTVPAWVCATVIADQTWLQGAVSRHALNFAKLTLFPEMLGYITKA